MRHRFGLRLAIRVLGLACGLAASASALEHRQGGYRFINPLLECEADQKSFAFLIPFQHKINSFVKKSGLEKKGPCSVAIYYRDLNNGPWFGYNEGCEFAPASLLKVPMMMAYLNAADDDPTILQKNLVYNTQERFNTSSVIQPPEFLATGQSYTIENLIFRMIAYSDNDAAVLLFDHAKQGSYQQTYKDLGLEIPGVRTRQDFMTVREYAAFFRILFNASYISKRNSEKALEILSRSNFKQGIAAGTPTGITVANKFGERQIFQEGEKTPSSVQLHDCGIVYYPGRPYLLCIMTRGEDMEQLTGVIRDVSHLVYDELDRQIKNLKP